MSWKNNMLLNLLILLIYSMLTNIWYQSNQVEDAT